ncbi:MAG: protoporphyrinogen oxidase [Planctomycetes bacterium]|nr:protoporphyrinogen oxidase [Planctomycetota bacterium]
MQPLVIVGGGISGLSLAWRLLADPAAGPPLAGGRFSGVTGPGPDITIIESSDRLGGNLHALHDRGFLIETGPTGFLDNSPETLRLCHLLGLEDRLRPANAAAAKRFLYVRGRLREAPLSPASFFLSGVLSLPGRLRVMCEPFIPARPDPEESVFDFAARRIGPEAARNLVQAMISGVYAGDAKQLSVGSALPKIHALERDHGGLVRGMFAKMMACPPPAPSSPPKRPAAAKEGVTRGGPASGPASGPAAGPAGPGGTLTSFDAGMEVLIHTLADRLRATGRCEILTGVRARGVSRVPRGSPPDCHPEPCPPLRHTDGGQASGGQGEGSPAPEVQCAGAGDPSPRAAREAQDDSLWRLTLDDGRAIESRALVSAIPSIHAATLFQSLDPALSEALRSIPVAPIAVVALAYQLADLPAPLDGFGLLIPRGEGPRSLGVLWDSSIFPGRAPERMVLVRAMIGGAQDPAAVDLSDGELLRIVRDDIRTTMGLTADPAIHWVIRHPHGIPQYTIGHAARLRAVEERRDRWPGLFFTGNSFRGISVNLCVEDSLAVAREVSGDLAGRSDGRAGERSS